jgi:hypothetical protein
MLSRVLLIAVLFWSCSQEDTVRPSVDMPISRIVIDGNSLAACPYGYTQALTDSGYEVHNCAISGQTVSRMIYDSEDVDTVIGDSAVLVVDEVTNELYFGATADSAFSRLKRYCQRRRQLHPDLRIIVVTPTPRSNSGTPIGFEANRVSVIAKMKADRSFYYRLSNAGEDSLIGYQGAELDATYYYDRVHHTRAGYNVRSAILMSSMK